MTNTTERKTSLILAFAKADAAHQRALRAIGAHMDGFEFSDETAAEYRASVRGLRANEELLRDERNEAAVAMNEALGTAVKPA